jgi:hypothetical protein
MEAAARTSKTPHALPDFLLAVLAELERVVNKDRAAWTVKTRLPVVPHAAQLAVLARLLLKGADKNWGDVFKHREKLDSLLEKAHRKTKGAWEAGLKKSTPAARNKYLNDAKAIETGVNRAVDFAYKNIGLNDVPLRAFTGNVQDTLAGLVGKVSAAVEMKVGPGTKGGAAGQVPGAVYGAVTMGMLAGGLVGRREMTPKELSAARIAVRLGSQKDEDGGPEPKEVKRLRKTLKELGPHLPKQRA